MCYIEKKTNSAPHVNNEHIPSIVVQVDTIYNNEHIPSIVVQVDTVYNNEHIPSIVVQVDTVYNFCISHLPTTCVAVTAGEHFKVQGRRLLV